MVAVVLTGLLVPCSSHAQRGGHARDAGPSPSERRRAIELYETSSNAYRSGDFARAAALLEEAYALFPQAVLLYNLARAYESQGETTRAIEAYERYLREDPDAEDRGGIEARLVTLREQVRRSEVAPAEAIVAPPPNAPDDTLAITGYAVLGIGGASIAAGAVLAGLAAADHATAIDPATTQHAAVDANERARSFGDVAIVLLASGAALAGVGVVLAASSGTASSGTASSGTTSLRLGPTGLLLEGTF